METQGQILNNSIRAKMLINVLKENDIKTIVEIGTWKGLGSTKCILDNMGNDCEFISLESNLNFYEIAKINLTHYENKFKLIYGRIIEKEEMLNFVSDKKLNLNQKIWLDEDLKNLDKCENVYHSLPSDIDFLLLDGGEFSTYSEWVKLKDRTTIVALDDIREMKTNQIYQELKKDHNYHLLVETEEGNGFAIFLKK